MSELFTEKAFWFMAALVLSLVAVIYRLFNGSIQKDLKIQRNEIKTDLIAYFEIKFSSDINDLKSKFSNLESKFTDVKVELESLKRHDNNNAKQQTLLLKKIITKLDIKDPEFFNDIL